MRRESLELRPPGHPHRDISLNNLASALGDRYDLSGSLEDLEEMLQVHREALELCPPGHPLRDSSLTALANALSKQYDRSGSSADLSPMPSASDTIVQAL